MDAPEAPWPGTCGDPDSATFGRAENTWTSGFEGAWTEEPTVRGQASHGIWSASIAVGFGGPFGGSLYVQPYADEDPAPVSWGSSSCVSCASVRASKVWDNSYFMDLLEYDWVQEESPAGHIQWIPVPKEGANDTHVPDIIMLTADIALLYVGVEPCLCFQIFSFFSLFLLTCLLNAVETTVTSVPTACRDRSISQGVFS